eukprot:SM000053S17421  [mRNA]  locus=s53:275306:278936:- [translate_table: standard]
MLILSLELLPQGFPHSGLSTYIRSMISTQVLLGAIGVGESTATVMGATFQWFVRDFTGMLGGILFTLSQGSNLDSKAKQWRLAADFMNDIGMLLDLLSPLVPKAFLLLLCLGSISRSITGVASGATRAALTQHFALQQNAADVSAKEGSQETVATIAGMLLGIVVARVTGGSALPTWSCFLLLTAFHVYANYRAVRCLCLTSLNTERTKILLREYIARSHGWPREVAPLERILPLPDNLIPSKAGTLRLRPIILGARLSEVIPPDEGGTICVILHKTASSADMLRGYTHALRLALLLDTAVNSGDDVLELEEMELEAAAWVEQAYVSFCNSERGWNLGRVLLTPQEWRVDWHPAA